MQGFYTTIKNSRVWLMPLCIVLLLGVIVTTPFVLGSTWAWGSSGIDHTLTYTKGELSWGGDTSIRADGSAEFMLFKKNYDGVDAKEKAVAPGTESGSTVRLVNSVKGSISYTAVLYEEKNNEALPVRAELTAEGASETTEYILPENAKDAKVIKALSGTLNGKQYLDFNSEWIWDFTTGDDGDIIDTELGNKEIPDNISVGFYLVVTDDNNYDNGRIIDPVTPDTGDSTHFVLWMIIAILSLLLLILLLIAERQYKKCNEE